MTLACGDGAEFAFGRVGFAVYVRPAAGDFSVAPQRAVEFFAGVYLAEPFGSAPFDLVMAYANGAVPFGVFGRSPQTAPALSAIWDISPKEVSVSQDGLGAGLGEGDGAGALTGVSVGSANAGTAAVGVGGGAGFGTGRPAQAQINMAMNANANARTAAVARGTVWRAVAARGMAV